MTIIGCEEFANFINWAINLQQIETDLNATNVQLNLSKDSPEQIIITLEKITKDRSNWRRIIRDAMDGTHPKVL